MGFNSGFKGLRRQRKVKVKFALEQATKAQRGEWRYSCTLSLTSALDGVGGQPHAPAVLPPVKRPCAHCTRAWCSPWPVGRAVENLAPIGNRSPSRPVVPVLDHHDMKYSSAHSWTWDRTEFNGHLRVPRLYRAEPILWTDSLRVWVDLRGGLHAVEKVTRNSTASAVFPRS